MLRSVVISIALVISFAVLAADAPPDDLRRSEIYWVKGFVAYRVGAVDEDKTTFEKRIAQGWIIVETVPVSAGVPNAVYVVLRAPELRTK